MTVAALLPLVALIVLARAWYWLDRTESLSRARRGEPLSPRRQRHVDEARRLRL